MFFPRPVFNGFPVLRLLLAAVFGGSMLASATGYALSLTDALDRANNSEPTYLAAKADFQGAQAREGQTFGALLPQISATFSTSMNHRIYDTLDSVIPDQRDKYNAHANQISLTQPVWRYVNLASHLQAKRAMAQAQFRMLSAEQELFSKVVSAWFEMLMARDEALFAAKKTEASRKEWNVMKRGGQLGSHSGPEVHEALAKYQQAEAEQFSAETESQLKLAALEQMTGPLTEFSFPFLRAESSGMDLDIEPQDVWMQALEQHNPSILAAQKALEAADKEISKQRAGHHPTVDIVASYGLNDQQVGGFPGQKGYEIWLRTIALQVNLPIFSGGTQSAKVKEAIATYDKARADLEGARRLAVLGIRQAWLGWRSAFARSQASRMACQAANSALQLAERGVVHGIKSERDVLQAKQQLESAQRDLNKARYMQISSFMRLKSLLGQATASDTMAIDALFIDAPNSSLPAATETPASAESTVSVQEAP